MTKTQINQILIATVSTIAAGVILDKLRQPKEQPVLTPTYDDSETSWFDKIFGNGNSVKLF